MHELKAKPWYMTPPSIIVSVNQRSLAETEKTFAVLYFFRGMPQYIFTHSIAKLVAYHHIISEIYSAPITKRT